MYYLLHLSFSDAVWINFSAKWRGRVKSYYCRSWLNWFFFFVLTKLSIRDCRSCLSLTPKALLTSIASRPSAFQSLKIPSSKSKSLYLSQDMSTSIHFEESLFSSPSSLLASCTTICRSSSDLCMRYCRKIVYQPFVGHFLYFLYSINVVKKFFKGSVSTL